MNTAIATRMLDHDIWDHPGSYARVARGVRKWKDRPAVKDDTIIRIIAFKRIDGQYGPVPRLLVGILDPSSEELDVIAERWVHATTIDEKTISTSHRGF